MARILGLVRSDLDGRLFSFLQEPLAQAGHSLVLAGTPEYLPPLDLERIGISADAPDEQSPGLITSTDPALVVTTRDDTPWAQSMIRAATDAGVPQVLVQTRVWMDRRAPHVRIRRRQWTGASVREAARRLTGRQPEAGLGGCTAIAASSDRFVSHLKARGVTETRIHLTGSPLHGSLPPETEAMPSALSGMDDAYTVYARGPGVPAQPEIRELIRLHRFCRLSGTRLVVLFETEDASHRDSLGAALPSDTILLDADASAASVIRGARALLTSSSNLVLDALALGRPIGLMRYLPVRGELNLGKATIGIDHRRDLEMRVIGLLTDPGLRDVMLEMYPQILEAETHNTDGGATQRLIDLVDHLIGADARAA